MTALWRARLSSALITAAATSVAWLGAFAWWQTRAPPAAPTTHPVVAQGSSSSREEAAPGAPPRPATAPGGTRRGSLLLPVVGVRPEELIDTWGEARANGARGHEAIDILAPQGTPVLAVAPGTVEKLFLSDDGGKTIYLRSGDRRRLYYYAHLDAYRPGLREGLSVRRGEVIGAVGSTGNADEPAPHLHFEVRDIAPGEPWYGASRAVNPYPLLAAAKPPVRSTAPARQPAPDAP